MSIGYFIGYFLGFLVAFGIPTFLLYCIINSWAKCRRLDREMKETKERVRYLERVIN